MNVVECVQKTVADYLVNASLGKISLITVDVHRQDVYCAERQIARFDYDTGYIIVIILDESFARCEIPTRIPYVHPNLFDLLAPFVSFASS